MPTVRKVAAPLAASTSVASVEKPIASMAAKVATAAPPHKTQVGVQARPVRNGRPNAKQQPRPSRNKKSQNKASFPWVGSIIALALVGAALIWRLVSVSGVGQPLNAVGASDPLSPPAYHINGPPTTPENLEAQAVEAKVGPDGVQTLDLVVNAQTMSYTPDVIKVKAGAPVRFNLSTSGGDPG